MEIKFYIRRYFFLSKISSDKERFIRSGMVATFPLATFPFDVCISFYHSGFYKGILFNNNMWEACYTSGTLPSLSSAVRSFYVAFINFHKTIILDEDLLTLIACLSRKMISLSVPTLKSLYAVTTAFSTVLKMLLL